MTPQRGHSVDWMTASGAYHPLANTAKWMSAGTLVAGVMAALTLWINQDIGSQNVLVNAVLIDMAPLPEAPAAIATLEPAPEVQMAELPEQVEQVLQDEPLPDLPQPDDVLPMPVTPTPEFIAPEADLPPDVFAPPEMPKPEVVPAPVPQEKPTPKKRKIDAAKPVVKTSEQPVAAQKAATAATKGQVKSLISRWGATIRKKVERRKTYPSAASGAEGKVTLRLTVTRGGALAGVSVARSSGNAALDKAAVQAVSRAGSFAAAPDGLTDASYSFTLQISFTN